LNSAAPRSVERGAVAFGGSHGSELIQIKGRNVVYMFSSAG